MQCWKQSIRKKERKYLFYHKYYKDYGCIKYKVELRQLSVWVIKVDEFSLAEIIEHTQSETLSITHDRIKFLVTQSKPKVNPCLDSKSDEIIMTSSDLNHIWL